MSDPPRKPWSGNPNAPQVSYGSYLAEKTNFAGGIITTILYGVVIAQFFRCMSALLGRARRDIKWVLVAHTVTMFSCVTISTPGGPYLQYISYVDNRGFPGTDVIPPGPVGYEYLVATDPLNSLFYVTFYLNQWLADGFLLYRFCVIFAMNYWFITLPCLMYLATVALGIMFIYHTLRPVSFAPESAGPSGLSFYVISVSLNVLLTLMIVTRLILHKKNIQNAIGTTEKPCGLYNAVVTMLVESCALYAVTCLLYVGPWVTGNSAQLLLPPFLNLVQVIGPLLIIQRVANRTALTSDAISGNCGLIRFRSGGELTSGGGTIPGGCPMGVCRETPGEGIGIESIHTINEAASARWRGL